MLFRNSVMIAFIVGLSFSMPGFSEHKRLPNLESPTEIQNLISELARIVIAANRVIIENQDLINSHACKKNKLFKGYFIKRVQSAYEDEFSMVFPKNDHVLKIQLMRAMVEVMDGFKELVTDPSIGFKGLIPSTFVSQLNSKVSRLGLNIKLTAPAELIRNPMNSPDSWEAERLGIMTQLENHLQKAIYDSNASFETVPAYRFLKPVYHDSGCIGCHGRPRDNPLNKDMKEKEWTNIDVTGFPMEGSGVGQFGGGVSVSILKSAIVVI